MKIFSLVEGGGSLAGINYNIFAHETPLHTKQLIKYYCTNSLNKSFFIKKFTNLCGAVG